jgi:hypothetical protein
MDEKDPLFRLVADQADTDRELLTSILETRVRIDPSRGTFSFLPGARERLGTRGTILTALLARKALRLVGAKIQEPILPRDLEVASGVKGNSLRPALKQLVDRGYARRADDGYSVPDVVLQDVARGLDNGGSQSD